MRSQETGGKWSRVMRKRQAEVVSIIFVIIMITIISIVIISIVDNASAYYNA